MGHFRADDAGPNEPVPDDSPCAHCGSALPGLCLPGSWAEFGFCGPACHLRFVFSHPDAPLRQTECELANRAIDELTRVALGPRMADPEGEESPWAHPTERNGGW